MKRQSSTQAVLYTYAKFVNKAIREQDDTFFKISAFTTTDEFIDDLAEDKIADWVDYLVGVYRSIDRLNGKLRQDFSAPIDRQERFTTVMMAENFLRKHYYDREIGRFGTTPQEVGWLDKLIQAD